MVAVNTKHNNDEDEDQYKSDQYRNKVEVSIHKRLYRISKSKD